MKEVGAYASNRKCLPIAKFALAARLSRKMINPRSVSKVNLPTKESKARFRKIKNIKVHLVTNWLVLSRTYTLNFLNLKLAQASSVKRSYGNKIYFLKYNLASKCSKSLLNDRIVPIVYLL
jgi:hypothetical protein